MSTSPISIIVHGARGRLGARICDLARRDPSLHLAGEIDRTTTLDHIRSNEHKNNEKHTFCGFSFGEITPDARADVVIDFTSDDGAREACRYALHARAALLVGTTALSTITLDHLRDAEKKIPILVAPNTSLGVAVLAQAAANVARALGAGYDISIVEAHHNQKKDAPSGTALRLARAISDTGAEVRADQVIAMRGGDVVGEHTIRFAGPGEYIELTHRATTRDVFAHGALRAARWLAGRGAGRYTIEDVLGLPQRT